MRLSWTLLVVALGACGDSELPHSIPPDGASSDGAAPQSCAPEHEVPPQTFAPCIGSRFDGRLYGARLQEPSPIFATGRTSYADLDGDGHLDAMVIDVGGEVYVLFGDGHGGFSAPSSLDAYQPISVATGDFDGDGATDIVVLCASFTQDGGTIRIFRNQGARMFAEVASYPALTDVYMVAAGDLDGNSSPEIVVAYRNDNHLSIFSRSGTTYTRREVATGAGQGFGTIDLELGDLDRNGIAEIVTTNNDRTFSVLKRNGGGGYTAHTTTVLTVAGGVGYLHLFDFDQDGDLDVLLGYREGFGVSGPEGILLYSTESNGNFSKRQLVGVDADFVVGDLDSDGLADLVVGDHVFHNTGTSFTSVQQLYSPSGETLVETPRHLADLDGDGTLDLMISGPSGIAVFDGSGGSFPGTTTGVWKPASPDGPPPLAGTGVFADLDGDGDKDYAAVTNLSAYAGELAVTYRDGDQWSAALRYDISPMSAVSVVAGDVDGDCRPDLLVGGVIRIQPPHGIGFDVPLTRTFRKRSDGTFESVAQSSVVGYSLGHLARLVDLDGDGKRDLWFDDPSPPMIGNGDGTFSAWTTNPIGGGGYYVLRDVDGDGTNDLVATTMNALWLARGLGGGTYETAQSITAIDSFWAAFAVSDLDGNGAMDYAIAARDLEVRLSHGGTLDAPIRIVTATPNTGRPADGPVTTLDANADGVADLSYRGWVTLQRCVP